MKKRGQVTVFVIIGLIVLIGLGLLIYFTGQQKEKQVNIEEEYTQVVEDDLVPIKTDVEFCLHQVAKNAIIKLGSQGGYLDTDRLRTNAYPEYDNTGVELFEGSGFKVPYWVYIRSSPDCTNCQLGYNIPALQGNTPSSIQYQLEQYINENINVCVDDLNQYRDKYKVTLGEPKSRVQFNEKDIFVGLDWDIELELGGTKSSINKYNTRLDLNFVKLYNLATGLLFQTEMATDNRVTESFTRDILMLLSLPGENAEIPPADGPLVQDFENPKVWIMDDVKNILKSYIAENANFLQVENSKESYRLITNDPYRESIYSKFQIKYYDPDNYYQKVRIRYNYFPNWPMYVKTTPGFGQIAMPETTYNNLIFLTISTANYNFKYDITHPMLITLEDDDAFGGEGYLLQYAYEVNLRGNEPYTKKTIHVNASDFVSNSSTMFAEHNQRQIPVEIRVVNGYTNQPMDKVMIQYTCIDKTVMAGVTDVASGNQVIKTNMPDCIGGYFSVFGGGFGADKLPADIIEGVPNKFTYKIYPEIEFELRPKKRLYSPSKSIDDVDVEHLDRDWEPTTAVGSSTASLNAFPEDKEKIMLVMVRMEENQETDYVRIATFNGSELLTNPPKIKLVPGTYKVYLISTLELDAPIIIPKREYDNPGLILTGDTEIPAVPLNKSLFVGSLMFDENNGYLELKPSQMKNKNIMNIVYAGIDYVRLAPHDSNGKFANLVNIDNVFKKVTGRPVTFETFTTNVTDLDMNTTALKQFIFSNPGIKDDGIATDLTVLEKITRAPKDYPDIFKVTFE